MAEPLSLPQRLTDDEILRSVETTVLDVLLPALDDDAEWARAAAVQLVGLVRHARSRGADRSSARLVEVAATLAGMGDNAIVAEVWDGDRSPASVMEAAGRALAAAVGRDDVAARQVRAVLRPKLVRQLDDELAETGPLVDAFRGKL